MGKVQMGPRNWLYPMHALILGANVDGKPNFMTIAWGGIASSNPPMIAISLEHHRYTYKGIRQNMTFSINLPSIEQVKETDYCGIVTGLKANKAEVCGFRVFYGNLESAPLIEQCPLNLECRVVHIMGLGDIVFIIGEIKETYISENCLNDGKPDVGKIRPLVYTEPFPHQYHALGEVIARAFDVGKELRAKE